MNQDTILIKKGEFETIIERKNKVYKFLFETEKIEVNIAELEPGSESRLFAHNGEEVHIVIQGELDYTVGDRVYKLNKGDILWHKSNLGHKAKNSSDKKVIYLTIGTPPTFKPSMT
jgi:uncharacterized cupin superfamily protein